METYFTPIKEIGNCPKVTKTALQTREGDWVCLNCNNLNFSFRKKCNRCKVQTRLQNQSSTAFYLDYYSKNYLYTQPMQTQPYKNNSHASTSANAEPQSQALSNLKQGRSANKENKTPEKLPKDLPSVSPLVKKYNARQTTPLSQCSSNESVWGVVVRDFEQVLASSGRSDEHSQGSQRKREQNSLKEEQQLQRMISSIML